MNHYRNSKIARLPDCLGESGSGLVEDRPETSWRPRVDGRLRVETTRAPIQAAGDRGVAATRVRARSRALRYDSLPSRRLIQPTATNGHPITSSKTSDAVATLADCCGRGRPRSEPAPHAGESPWHSRIPGLAFGCGWLSNRVKPRQTTFSNTLLPIRGNSCNLLANTVGIRPESHRSSRLAFFSKTQ